MTMHTNPPAEHRTHDYRGYTIHAFRTIDDPYRFVRVTRAGLRAWHDSIAFNNNDDARAYIDRLPSNNRRTQETTR